MARWIGEQEIEDLAVGAAVMGAGGGGDPYVGKLMVLREIQERGPIQLLDPSEVPDDAVVIPTAIMGAPTINIEKLPNGDEALKSLRALEEVRGEKAFATMPIECGGINSTLPFVAASRAGLPVVDADGMGRAFPELQMETFHIYGLQASPSILHNEQGVRCDLNLQDNETLEHIARGVTIRMGGTSHTAHYCMTGAELKRIAIPNTVSLCIELGKALREEKDPIGMIRQVTQKSGYGEAIVLFKGKVVDVERRSSDAFVRGKALIEGFEEHQGKTLRVDFQNENLIAKIDDKLVAMVPDLIVLLDLETGTPITTEALKYGYRVVCLAIPTPPIMRTPEALAVWGPRCFGYDCDFTPAEELN